MPLQQMDQFVNDDIIQRLGEGDLRRLGIKEIRIRALSIWVRNQN
jgi:hypothetical protein